MRFILTGVCERNRERADRFAALLAMRFPGRPVFRAGYEPTSVLAYENHTSSVRALAEIGTMPLFAFAGIARPETFAQTLRDLELNIVGFQGLADHVSYGQEQVAALYGQAGRMGAAACITTEKDMVKLHSFARDLPVYALRMEARLNEDFHVFLADKLASYR